MHYRMNITYYTRIQYYYGWWVCGVNCSLIACSLNTEATLPLVSVEAGRGGSVYLGRTRLSSADRDTSFA